MTDEAFRAWIQTLPSALDGKSFSDWLPDLGEWRNLACHVRRAGRSGVGYKEEFACIPMSDKEHKYQHQNGELACLLKFTADPQLKVTLLDASPVEAERLAKQWFDAQVEKYRQRWLAETPEGRAWAKKHEVEVMA
jgi:hypothetical protein